MPSLHVNKIHKVSAFQDVDAYLELKREIKRWVVSISMDARLGYARAFCARMIESYWSSVERDLGRREVRRDNRPWQVKPHRLLLPALPDDQSSMADKAGRLIAEFPVEDAGYLVGSIYTVMLPEQMRSEMGAYYTPPPLVGRLIDNAVATGVDLSTASVIDPACGGGAFLAPVALRMMRTSTIHDPEGAINDIAARLHGIELDPFAGWMTEVLLEATLLPLCKMAGIRLPDRVRIGDALDEYPARRFDLVIGNPPYGRIRLNDAQRERYARSLFGHANLYGVFTDLALRLVRHDGVIAFLTPTSFLGGQYFKALRALLTEMATPSIFDFVSDRNGVFDDVLQETILVAYQMTQAGTPARVSRIVPKGLEDAQIEPIGAINVPRGGTPWVVPREPDDAGFVERLLAMPVRLSDLGYQISTGPLVWNRHKSQFRGQPERGAYPVIWSESISPAGFAFSAKRRNHAPFITIEDAPHLITKKSCVLLQRTTAKEQGRRLVCATIPQPFIDQHDGVVVENHLNIIYSFDQPRVSPHTVACLLNTMAVDRAFRCISGSVAVSAYELEALPLPSVQAILDLERLIEEGAPPEVIEAHVSFSYEL